MAHTGETINGSAVQVKSADVWSNTTVTNGGGLELNVAGAVAYDTTLSNEAYLWLQSSGSASGVQVGNGSCRVSAYNTGVVVENVHVDSGVNAVARPRLDVRNGATVRGAVVSGAYVQVTGGTSAKIYDVTLDLSAQMRVYNAAYGSGITLSHTGCDLKVYQNNASVTDLTVLGGIASAYETGKITNATVGDRLHVSSAGYASGVQILSNGTAFINGADALIEDVHINSGGSNAAAYPNLDIRVGSAVNVVASGAAIQVTGASAFISGVTMEQNATLVVWNNGVARDITNSSGTFRVWGGANASNATVYGIMEVSSAGVANSVNLYGTNAGGATNVAYIKVSSGGRIADVVVSGGRLDVSSGAAAENVTVSAGYGMVVRGATVSNCSAVGTTGNNYIFVQQGATLSGGYFADNGRLRLEAGCSATDLVFENSIANANFIIDPGAYISSYTLRGNTVLDLRGTALNGTVSGGTLNYTSGGTLTGLTVSNGGNFNVGTTGDITDVTFKAGGKFNGKFYWDYDFTVDTIANGSAAIADAVVVSAARMDVGDGGTASGTTVSAGNVVVAAGGLFTNGAFLGTNTGGGTTADYAVIYAGGKIADTTVSGARVDVSAGASGENIVVSGGYGLVVRGATATNASAVGTAAANYVFIQQAATLNGGYFTGKGELRVDGGCSATDIVFDNGGATIIGNGAYTSKLTIRGANANINYAGTVLDATVSGGALNFSSGTLTGMTVSAGAAKISSGGVVNDLTVSAGNAQVFGGGTVNGADVKSGATLYASKGTVENVSVELGGTLSVRDGGYASGVSGNGYVETYTGTISSAVMANGSSFRVYAPGYAQDVWIDNTELVVRGNGAILSNAYISGGKITSIQNYGIAYNLTQSTGKLQIDVREGAAGKVSGATLTNVRTEIQNTGELSGFVAAGNSTIVNTGAKLLDGTALSGNSIDVMGGYASHITVSSGAQIWVSSGGMITDLSLQGAYAEVNAGGNISGVTVASNVARADFRVLNGFAEEVNLTGGIVVIRGANASAANVSATGNGNTVHAQASGRIDGVKIESGAQLLINSQGGAVGGSVFSATLNNAKTNVHHQGY
ncbi:MAG: hypothetical protein J6Y54_04555, partial [Lentisphaeria bacterium]|nr:hypothetical protein [Lentisphaeria bacterium]